MGNWKHISVLLHEVVTGIGLAESADASLPAEAVSGMTTRTFVGVTVMFRQLVSLSNVKGRGVMHCPKLDCRVIHAPNGKFHFKSSKANRHRSG